MTWLAIVVGLLLASFVHRMRANPRIERPPVLDEDGRPYEDHAVTLSDGERVSLIDAGEGPTILLIPGADGIRQTWRYQVQPLARRFRVLAPDLRSRIPGGATFDRLCRDVEEIMEARAVPRAVVVGQSLGGAIALRFAVLHPERVRALVVANTLTRISYDHVGLNRTLLVPVAMATTRYLPTVLASAFGRVWSLLEVWLFDRSPGFRRVIDYALWTGPRTVRPSVSAARVDLLKGEDLRPDLPGLDLPTLVMKGPRDMYVPVAWAREIADLVPGARYVEVPGTGHVSHISMPDRFNRILFDWMDEIGALDEPEEADA